MSDPVGHNRISFNGLTSKKIFEFYLKHVLFGDNIECEVTNIETRNMNGVLFFDITFSEVESKEELKDADSPALNSDYALKRDED